MCKSTFSFNPDLASLYLKAAFGLCVGSIMFVSGLNNLYSAKSEQDWSLIILGLLLVSYDPLKLLKAYRMPIEQRKLYLKKVRYSGPKSWRVLAIISYPLLFALLTFYIWAFFHAT
jgi:hypothetical protein